jgi:hypothetical protein
MTMKPDQEPPIREQVGLISERQSRRFKKGRAIRRHARPELFNTMIKTISGWELWVTPYNSLFIVEAETGALGYPRLLTKDVIHFTPALSNVPLKVIWLLCTLLEKQKAIRRKMVDSGEYEVGEYEVGESW